MKQDAAEPVFEEFASAIEKGWAEPCEWGLWRKRRHRVEKLLLINCQPKLERTSSRAYGERIAEGNVEIFKCRIAP